VAGSRTVTPRVFAPTMLADTAKMMWLVAIRLVAVVTARKR
jgi:hypothetical protein